MKSFNDMPTNQYQYQSYSYYNEIIPESSQLVISPQISSFGLKVRLKEEEEEESDDSSADASYQICEPPKTRKKRCKQNMTFEQLRTTRRESNRIAASRCRQKKLNLLNELEIKTKLLSKENKELENRMIKLREEVEKQAMTLVIHKATACLLDESKIRSVNDTKTLLMDHY